LVYVSAIINVIYCNCFGRINKQINKSQTNGILTKIYLKYFFFFWFSLRQLKLLACETVGEGTEGFKHMCVCFGRILSGHPYRYLPCPGGGWRPLSPDTMTVWRKMPPVAEFEPAMVRVATDALGRSATPPPLKYW